MLSTFYVLHALCAEWSATYRGARIESAYSQQADELSIAIGLPDDEHTMRIRLGGPLRYMTVRQSSGRRRRNTADVLSGLPGRTIIAIRTADRDRIVHLDLSGDTRLDVVLFGSSPNALIVDAHGVVSDAFKGGADGDDPPVPRRGATVADFRARVEGGEWTEGSTPTAMALSRAFPLFNRTLAAECLHRAGAPAKSDDLDSDDLGRLVDAVADVESACFDPAPAILRRDGRPIALALCELKHIADARPEEFSTVSEAVRIYVSQQYAWMTFDAERGPVLRSVGRDFKRATRRVERLRSELASSSRADEYEKWGHVLMANPNADVPFASEDEVVRVEFVDPFEIGDEPKTIRIPLRSDQSLVENAQRFYEKARDARAKRKAAVRRLSDIEREERDLGAAVATLQSAADPDKWRALKKSPPPALGSYLEGRQRSEQQNPYRCYDLGGGFEAWVGRNARQNDELSTRVARKFDLWLHARGVGGSHVVLRLPTKGALVPEETVSRAAGIAAWHSKARGSGLVPVIVAERKFVRKPKRAAPGAVVVDRHRVVIVEPRLPDDGTQSA